jgi:hypothetical protein
MNIEIVSSEFESEIGNIISNTILYKKTISNFKDLLCASLSNKIQKITIYKLDFNSVKSEYKILISANIDAQCIYFHSYFKEDANNIIYLHSKTNYFLSHLTDLSCYINPNSKIHTIINHEEIKDYFKSLEYFLPDYAKKYHDDVHNEYIKFESSKILGHIKTEFIFEPISVKINFDMTFYDREKNANPVRQINVKLSKDLFEISELGICVQFWNNFAEINLQNYPEKYLCYSLSKKYNIDYVLVSDIINSNKNFNIFNLPDIIEYLRLLKY